MEKKGKKERKLHPQVIETGEHKPARNQENIERRPSSVVASKFTKTHSRGHESFGSGHEPGTTPGTGF